MVKIFTLFKRIETVCVLYLLQMTLNGDEAVTTFGLGRPQKTTSLMTDVCWDEPQE